MTALDMSQSGANKLRQWREQTQLKQRHVAQRLDVDQGYVSAWERGDRRPSLENAVALERLTEGAVCVEDWVDNEPQAAAS